MVRAFEGSGRRASLSGEFKRGHSPMSTRSPWDPGRNTGKGFQGPRYYPQAHGFYCHDARRHTWVRILRTTRRVLAVLFVRNAYDGWFSDILDRVYMDPQDLGPGDGGFPVLSYACLANCAATVHVQGSPPHSAVDVSI